MQIETYEIEEIKNSEASSMAADSFAIELCEKLGLVGQQKLWNPETGDRIQFPRITKLQSLVYETLFPQKAKVQAFETEVIPLRVLEVLEKAKQSGMFIRFDVWHNPTRKEDPILVAHTGTPNPQSWDANYATITGTFLVARWGEALAPFADLCKEAKSHWIAARKAKLKREVHDRNGQLERLKDDADVAFTSGVEPSE